MVVDYLQFSFEWYDNKITDGMKMNMMIESVNKSVIEPVLPVKPPEGNMAPLQVRFPGDEECVIDNKEDPREEKTPDFSQTADLSANIQNSLDIIHNVKLKFSVHEASGQVMEMISDEETGEVIREIPSSEILNIAAKLDEMVGLLFDQKG